MSSPSAADVSGCELSSGAVVVVVVSGGTVVVVVAPGASLFVVVVYSSLLSLEDDELEFEGSSFIGLILRLVILSSSSSCGG